VTKDSLSDVLEDTYQEVSTTLKNTVYPKTAVSNTLNPTKQIAPLYLDAKNTKSLTNASSLTKKESKEKFS